MGRLAVIACVLVAIAVPGDDPKEKGSDEAKSPQLSVRIVPTNHKEKAGRVIDGTFHVVVTNVSKQPVRLWKDWCSWGYYNLSFTATGWDGKTVAVKKLKRSSFANWPDWMLLPPGDHMVLDVSFKDHNWEGLPVPEANKSLRVSLRAVYEVTERTGKYRVWTGRVASPEAVYTILGFVRNLIEFPIGMDEEPD
jgi:hypothetical protein